MLQYLYERLTLNDTPSPADLIFVLAGKMERKQYGLELYRAGLAPRLILSVGRFEVSKMPALDLEETPQLLRRRDKTAPLERHFFCEIDSSGMRIHTAKLRRWNTYGEALGLREYSTGESIASAIIISTDIHLRRVAVAFASVFRDLRMRFYYCPVPPDASSLGRCHWWTRADDRNYVIAETVKLAAYQGILSMPDFIIRPAMRLKK